MEQKAVQSLRERNAYGQIIQINSIAGRRISAPPLADSSVNAYKISKYGLTAMQDVFMSEMCILMTDRIKFTVG